MNKAQHKAIWQILERRDLVSSPWLRVESQRCALPNGKIIDDFYTVEQPHWALILAQTPAQNWVLTEQYRHGLQKYLWEFPAGIIEPGEDPLHAAQRELREETGYASATWHSLAVLPVNPDRQGTLFHIFYAAAAQLRHAIALDASEDIKNQEFSTAQIWQMIGEQQFIHPHHLAAWLLHQRATLV